MSTVMFEVEDEKATQLASAAHERGIAVEELLRRITDEFLARKENFETAAKFVLAKNAELYRRLAQ